MLLRPLSCVILLAACVFSCGWVSAKPDEKRPPTVTYTVRPEYPLSMRWDMGFQGKVILEFTVDAEGRVRNPFVVKSNNPAFNDPAIEALLKWRFKPGLVNGHPAAVKMRIPIIFHIYGGINRFAVTTKRSYQEKLPPELRFDTAPQLENIEPAVYPYTALLAKEHGKVEFSFMLNPQGRVVRVNILKSPGDAFTQAALAMAYAMRFKPALKAGQPTYALLQMSLDFDPEFGDVKLSKSGRKILSSLQRKDGADAFATLDELDQPLAPISRQPPEFPPSLGGKVKSGQALIEFFVDQYGQAQLPHIVSASQPEFGYAACQAIATWQFHPPVRHGEPVVARVRIPVDFN